MVSAVYNENLLKLRELSDKICESELKTPINDSNEYKEVVHEITDLVQNVGNTIGVEKNKATKLKCYENMCEELKKILHKIKIK